MRTQHWGHHQYHGLIEPSGINAANPAKAAVHVWAKGLARRRARWYYGELPGPGRIHSEQIDQRIHPTEESQRAFAAQIPLGYRGSSGHGLPGNLSVLDESAVPHGRAHPSTGLPARLLTGRAPRTRAWLNPMRPYRALAGCRLGRSSRRGGSCHRRWRRGCPRLRR